jgi:hypothetical protein
VSKKVLTTIAYFLLLFVAMFSWSISSAIGSSPDEGFILTSIWCDASAKLTDSDVTVIDRTNCREDRLRSGRVVVPALIAEPHLCYIRETPSPNLESAECQTKLTAVEVSTDEFMIDAEASPSIYPNQYFNVMRNLAGSDIAKSVLFMRMTNCVIATLFFGVAFTLCRNRNLDLCLTVLASISPVGIYFVSSVNTSSWAIIGTSSFAIGLSIALKNFSNLKILMVSILYTVSAFQLSTFSRHESKFTNIVLATAIIVSSFKQDVNFKFYKNRIQNLVLGVGVAIILWIANGLFVKSDFFELPVGSLYNIFSTGEKLNLLIHNTFELPRFILGFLGSWGLGWFELQLHHVVWLFGLQSLLLIIGFALNTTPKVTQGVFFVLLLILNLGILLFHQEASTKIGTIVQPRYFLPFFLGIVIIAAANKTARFPNSLVLTVAILATISNSIALRDTIRRYTTGQDVFISKSLNSPREWWWNFGPAPETVWLIGSLAFAMLFAVIIYERKLESAETSKI